MFFSCFRNTNPNTTHHRILQTAPYSSSSSSSPFKSRFLWHHEIVNHSTHWSRSATANGVAGTMLFSVAASTLAEEVHAKELPPAKKFNDVVLYQYEACPFCNKVKDGRATQPSSISANHTRHRILQKAPYSSSSSSSSSPFKSRFLWHHEIVNHSTHWSRSATANGVAGTMLFSVAASTLAEEVHAKELPPAKKFNDVVLYQYEACPFCNKVKAFLDYYDIPYKVVEVNPINKKEIKWSDYKKVPILMVDGEQMVDSSEIIDKLFLKIHPENPDSSLEWRRWVDNHLVHVLSPNIYRSPSEALESFDYITTQGNFSFMERITAKYAGAAAMYFVSKKLKKRHNITDERAALYEAAEKWVDALNGQKFLGGSKPSLADLAVFGVLRPIRYLKSGRDMLEHTRIGEWYSRMESEVGESSRVMEQK